MRSRITSFKASALFTLASLALLLFTIGAPMDFH